MTTDKFAKILIVDDEEGVRNFIERALQIAGYETSTADSAAAAIAAVEANGRPDLLLTDLAMPEVNGDELVRRLRRNFPDLKVIYLTGFADKLFESRSQLWENEAFLEKPASVAAIHEAVSLALYGHLRGPGASA